MDPATLARVTTLRVLGVLAVLAAVVLVFSTGLVDWLRAPERVRGDIAAWGAVGQLGFVGLYALTQPFGAPGTVLLFAAPFIWAWPVAFGLSLSAALLGSSLGFWVARLLARDWVRPRIPPRVLAYEAALAQRAFRTIFVLRLVFGMQQTVHALCGVSTVGFGTYVLASAAAYVPPLLAIALFGDRLLELLLAVPWWVAAGAMLLVLAAVFWRWRRGALRRA